jgi:hypothetical protein
MRTHRFGRKIKLPATIAIKHQLRKLMLEDSVKKAEAEARAEVFRGQPMGHCCFVSMFLLNWPPSIFAEQAGGNSS